MLLQGKMPCAKHKLEKTDKKDKTPNFKEKGSFAEENLITANSKALLDLNNS